MNAFLPPMLCSRLTDTALLHDPRYIAEPKLDGMRVQLHIAAAGRVAHCYSRPGQEQVDWRPRTGRAAVLCWGLVSGRLLRHPVSVGWR